VVSPQSGVSPLSQLEPDTGVHNDLLGGCEQGGYRFDDLIRRFQINDLGLF
jgi:hypothetical protein